MSHNAIFIPSRSRADIMVRKALTIDHALHTDYPVYVVVREQEKLAYADALEDTRVKVLSTKAETIAETYDFCMDYCAHHYINKACMMDDDLLFAERLSFHRPELTAFPPEEAQTMFSALFRTCTNQSPISSLRHRRFAHNEKEPVKHNAKCIGVLCCYVPVVSKYEFEWGQGSMYDHNMVLTLLSEGYQNTMLCSYTLDDGLGHMHPTGCGEYRTLESHSNAARALAAKFPEAVRLRTKYVEKVGGYLTDVTIYASKAFKHRRAVLGL